MESDDKIIKPAFGIMSSAGSVSTPPILIFICDFDLFGKGQYKYTFISMCEEVKNLPLNEGRTTIFMNANGYCGNVSEDCKLFLQTVKSEFTYEPFSAILKSEVERVKSSVEWRTEYMRLSEWIEDEIEMVSKIGDTAKNVEPQYDVDKVFEKLLADK